LLGKDLGSSEEILDASSAKKDQEMEKKRDKVVSTSKQLKSLEFKAKINGKTGSLQKKMIKLKNESTNAQNDFQNEQKEKVKFSIFEKLYDPESFCEKMVSQIQSRYFNQEFKLLQCELVAKIMDHNKIVTQSFFSFLEANMKIGSVNATKYMYFSAIATHNHIPIQVTDHLMRTIASNFAMEGNRTEHVTYGLNTIRLIATKNPDAMPEDLLNSLVSFRTSKEKPISNSAIALLTLYREINPTLLLKKYRGFARTTAIHDEEDLESEEEQNSDENTEEINSRAESDSDNDSDATSSSEYDSESENDEITLGDVEKMKGVRKKKESAQEESEALRKQKIADKYKNWRINPLASTTNKEKAKNKPNPANIEKVKKAKGKKSIHQKFLETKNRLKQKRKIR